MGILIKDETTLSGNTAIHGTLDVNDNVQFDGELIVNAKCEFLGGAEVNGGGLTIGGGNSILFQGKLELSSSGIDILDGRLTNGDTALNNTNLTVAHTGDQQAIIVNSDEIIFTDSSGNTANLVMNGWTSGTSGTSGTGETGAAGTSGTSGGGGGSTSKFINETDDSLIISGQTYTTITGISGVTLNTVFISGNVAGSSNNVFIGHEVADQIIDSSTQRNVVIGTTLGRYMPSKTDNVIIGVDIFKRGSGDRNVAIGSGECLNNGGSGNVVLGYAASTYGDGNGIVSIGYESGSNRTGSSSTFIGGYAGKGVQGVGSLVIDGIERNTSATESMFFGHMDATTTNQNLTINANLNIKHGLSISGTSGISGTYYVAGTSGGSPTTKLTFLNGVLVSEDYGI